MLVPIDPGVPNDYLEPGKRYGDFSNYSSFWTNRGAKIKILLCPSDVSQEQNWDCALMGIQVTSTGYTISIDAYGDTAFGNTNYVAIAGRLGEEGFLSPSGANYGPESVKRMLG